MFAWTIPTSKSVAFSYAVPASASLLMLMLTTVLTRDVGCSWRRGDVNGEASSLRFVDVGIGVCGFTGQGLVRLSFGRELALWKTLEGAARKGWLYIGIQSSDRLSRQSKFGLVALNPPNIMIPGVFIFWQGVFNNCLGSLRRPAPIAWFGLCAFPLVVSRW